MTAPIGTDAEDPALVPYAVACALADEFGLSDPETALQVADLTGGWPALVRLAGDALRGNSRVELAAAMTAPGTPAADWIRRTVLAALPAGAEDVLRAIATIDATSPVSQALCEAVAAVAGLAIPSDLETSLRRSGVLVPQRHDAGLPPLQPLPAGRTSELVLVPALALVLHGENHRPPAQEVARVAARTHEIERRWLAAALAWAAADDRSDVLRLVVERGEDMLRGGGAGRVVRLIDEVIGTPGDTEPAELRRTYADALRMAGDPGRARRAFAALTARAGDDGWSPGLAARVAGLDYLCGQFESALRTLDRCHVPDQARDPLVREELVDWLACRVHVLAMLGRPAEAKAAAARCLDTAELLGNARQLGVAHLAAARTCRGTRKDLHHDQALRSAIEADDAVTATRVLAAQTSLLLAAARYDQACTSGREAVRLARLCCPPGLQAAAMHNLGEALARTGQLGEARWQLECSVALCRRLGPARAALGLVGLGDIHRLLGAKEQSRAAYEEAVELSRGSGDVQVLVSALSGRALLAADQLTSRTEGPVAPEEAGPEECAAEALRLAPADLAPMVLTTLGRVALARGDRAAAAEQAARAVTAARDVRATDLLADALELESATMIDPARARASLHEALSIWSTGGAAPAAARVEVLIGRLPGADGGQRSRAREAARNLRRLGMGLPWSLAAGGDCGCGTVTVEVLGPFSVRVEGVEVPLTAWRSRQARTLVKILAACRGRVVTRDRLCDLLWPDDDPARTGHRLSVLLATVRGVLDPSKRWPPDRYLVADQMGMRLDLSTVLLDADLLLGDAEHASELLERGDTDQAREVLAHVDLLFRGGAFEDEPGEWSDVLRDEVRSAWSRSVRRLATLRLRDGRGPEALEIFARLLAVDPYDEQVHRRLVTCLVRAGRHGEARRAFDRWSEAMRDIDAPLPDPRENALVLTSR